MIQSARTKAYFSYFISRATIVFTEEVEHVESIKCARPLLLAEPFNQEILILSLVCLTL
jgi:hypothetical protein